MAEPHASAAGAVIGAAAGASLTVVGAQVDALAVGLVAAIFMSVWLPDIDSKLKSFAGVAMSALISGYGAHVAAVLVAPKVGAAPEDLRLLIALLTGATGPTVIPVAMRRLKTEVEVRGGEK